MLETIPFVHSGSQSPVDFLCLSGVLNRMKKTIGHDQLLRALETISQAELAARMTDFLVKIRGREARPVTPQKLNHIVKGRRRPTVDQAAAIYSVLGIPPDLWARNVRS